MRDSRSNSRSAGSRRRSSRATSRAPALMIESPEISALGVKMPPGNLCSRRTQPSSRIRCGSARLQPARMQGT